jgi:hypothetical protein
MNKKLVAAIVLLAGALGIAASSSVYEMLFASTLCVSYIALAFATLVLLSGKTLKTLYWVGGATSAVLLAMIAMPHTVFVQLALDHAMNVRVGTTEGVMVGSGAIAGVWSSSLRLAMQRLGLIS